MYNSSKRKQPKWLVLSVIIIVLGGIVIWLLHNRHVKQEAQLAQTQSVQVESVQKDQAPATVPVTPAEDSQAPAQADSSQPAQDQAQAPADAQPAQSGVASKTIQDLQAQVQMLQQSLSDAQQQLEEGKAAQKNQSLARSQKALKQAKKDVAYLKNQVSQLKKQLSSARQLNNQNQDYVAKLQVENQQLRSLLTEHGIALPQAGQTESAQPAAAASEPATSASNEGEAGDVQDVGAAPSQGENAGQEQGDDNSAQAGGSQDDSGSAAPVVAITDAGTTPVEADNTAVVTEQPAASESAENSAASTPAQVVPEHALPAQIVAKDGALNYRVDIAGLTRKADVNTPIKARYILQYQLVTGQNVFKVIGSSNSTVQSIVRLQGQLSYPTRATPINLRVEVRGPKGVIYDATYPVNR